MRNKRGKPEIKNPVPTPEHTESNQIKAEPQKKVPRKVTVQMFETLARSKGITLEELIVEGIKSYLARDKMDEQNRQNQNKNESKK